MPAWVRGTLLLLVALGVGAACGAAIERSLMSRTRDQAMDKDVLMRTLDRELGLDTVQRSAIERVLAHHQAAIDSAWRAVRPSVHAAIDSSQMEIVDILRPDQRERFMTLLRVAHPGMTTMQRSPASRSVGPRVPR